MLLQLDLNLALKGPNFVGCFGSEEEAGTGCGGRLLKQLSFNLFRALVTPSLFPLRLKSDVSCILWIVCIRGCSGM